MFWPFGAHARSLFAASHLDPPHAPEPRFATVATKTCPCTFQIELARIGFDVGFGAGLSTFAYSRHRTMSMSW